MYKEGKVCMYVCKDTSAGMDKALKKKLERHLLLPPVRLISTEIYSFRYSLRLRVNDELIRGFAKCGNNKSIF